MHVTGDDPLERKREPLFMRRLYECASEQKQKQKSWLRQEQGHSAEMGKRAENVGNRPGRQVDSEAQRCRSQ